MTDDALLAVQKKFANPDHQLALAMDVMSRQLLDSTDRNLDYDGFHVRFNPRMAMYWVRSMRQCIKRVGMEKEFPLPTENWPRAFDLLASLEKAEPEGF